MSEKARQPDPAEEIGEWMHERLMESFGLETEAWAVERIERVSDALHLQRPYGRRLGVEVLWMQEMNAYAAPGAYVYISRELLQRTASDDPAALAVAHEMAHHDLGHLDLFAGRLNALRHVPGNVPGNVGLAAVAALRAAQRLWTSPNNEMEADAYALDLCIGAGYDGKKCLELFDIMEAYAIDHGDLDMVFGTDEMLRPQPAGLRGKLSKLSASKWQRARGYYPIRDRKAALLGRLSTIHRFTAGG